MTFPRSLRRHPVGWILAGLLAVGLIGAGIWALWPASVTVVSLQKRDLTRTFVLVGRVRPYSTAAVGSSISGTVRLVVTRAGDRVQEGELLIGLDDREARAGLAEAEASLVEAAASAESTADIARVEASRAERDLERIRALFEEGARSRQQLDQAEQRWLEARARLDAALAGSTEESGEASIPAAVLRARAAVGAARARLALTRIEAPAPGIVLTRSTEPGDVVQPGRPMVEIALDGPTEIVVFPAEEDLGALEVGARATVSADAYPDRSFEARVSLIGPAVDPDQGTVEVRLSVADPPEYLRPFMTVSVNIEADRRTGVPVLPTDGVRGLGTDEPWVMVVRDGRAERRSVEVGPVAEGWVEIRSGVAPEESVVVSEDPPEPGARVRVRTEETGSG